MRYRRLTSDAIILPDNPKGRPPWAPQGLGAGSVVAVLKATKVSPVTRDTDEPYVRWMDVAGRVTEGWLPRTAGLEQLDDGAAHKVSRMGVKSSANLSSWDIVRDYVFRNQTSFKQWLLVKGPSHPTLLTRVVVELGGSLKGTDDPTTLVKRLIRLVHNTEVPMAETDTMDETETSAVKKTKKVAKNAAKAAKGKAAKKATKKVAEAAVESAPARSMSRSAGEALLPLVKGRDVKAMAKRMANDEQLSKAELIQLRDAINEQAATAREADDTDTASALSLVNRVVRRLARSA